MKASATLIFIAIACIGCSRDGASPETGQASFSGRYFRIDPKLSRAQVDVIGASVGTADAQKIDLVLRSLKISGEVADVAKLADGSEGGAFYCITFNRHSDRASIFEVLASIATDTAHTRYSIVSVKDCGI